MIKLASAVAAAAALALPQTANASATLYEFTMAIGPANDSAPYLGSADLATAVAEIDSLLGGSGWTIEGSFIYDPSNVLSIEPLDAGESFIGTVRNFEAKVVRDP